jgi:hypothetical protein
MTFDYLDITYGGSPANLSFHTIIDITSSVVGTVKLGADDTFT